MICMFKPTHYDDDDDDDDDDVLENIWNMCLEIYELDPAKFISAPGLAWQAVFKKTKIKLDFLTDINISLMVEKDIRGEMSLYLSICKS